MLGDFCIGHGVTFKATFLSLDADINEIDRTGVLHIAVRIGGNTNNRALANCEYIVINLDVTCT
jgi:hypothetical protein